MEDQVLSFIQKSGLTRITDDITSLLRYTIRVKTSPVGEAELPLGISKIGGLPDLPPDSDWPEWNDQPLPLIAQIRLADIAPYDRSGELPQTGFLQRRSARYLSTCSAVWLIRTSLPIIV